MKNLNIMARAIILSALVFSHLSAISNTRRIQKAYCYIAIAESQKATSNDSLKLNEAKESTEKKSNK